MITGVDLFGVPTAENANVGGKAKSFGHEPSDIFDIFCFHKSFFKSCLFCVLYHKLLFGFFMGTFVGYRCGAHPKYLLVVFYFISFGVVSSQLLVAEQQAMHDLANTFIPLPVGWNKADSSTACNGNWIGITCTTDGLHVTVLSIAAFSLQGGTIPPSIGNLKQLARLDLSFNQIAGTIPSSIGSLTLLQTLILGSNQLTGTIPTEIGNLTKLSFLYLNRCQLNGTIPSSIRNLAQLAYFSLGDNQLYGTIPEEIGNFTKLVKIELQNNQLTGTIPPLGNLSSLSYFTLNDNQLDGTIPAEIGHFTSLVTLDFQSNRLTGTIPPLGGLARLQSLNFNDNQLNGSIPSSIGNLTSLKSLELQNNYLTGPIPSEIGKLSILGGINLSNNSLSGTIPLEIGDINYCTTLNFNDNKLEGSIPSEIGNITSLNYLYLANNQLNWSIPSSLGNINGLRYIDLKNNQLSGTIPPSIDNLNNLYYLDLSNNQVNGPIPSLANLTSLRTLYLQNNQLSGCFNDSLSGVYTCNVSSNQLTCFPAVCAPKSPQTQQPISNSPGSPSQPASNSPGSQPSPDIVNEPPGFTPETSTLPIALGVSIPIGLALIAGAIFLLLFLRRRKNQKKQQNNVGLLPMNGTTSRLSQVLPTNMVINYSDLKFGRELGSGDFGKVYEGEWQKAKVAIKVNTNSDFASFYQEAELMLNLRPHPNVVQTLGYCEGNNSLVVVVEYCDGGSLDMLLFDSNGIITTKDQINLIGNIAKGIYHLHTNNIIHRDLAARNVLLSHSVPKISDFGMSRRVDEVKKHSQTKATLGPIRWMAPESLKSTIYNEKTDVWSFGILCWEIISRKEPHLEEDPLDIGQKIRDQFYTPLIPEDCDPRLKQLMKDCWNQDPEKRPDMKSICNQVAEFI